MSRFFAGPLPRTFGHRGASGTLPENTMPAFEAALELGADALELDVHRSTDGEIVVIHDPTLDRTTDGTGPVRERTLEELRGFDAGYRFSPDGGRTFPFRGEGFSIPTLREVLETFPDTPLILEIKQVEPPLEEDLARLLQQTGAEERVLVFSLSQDPIDRYRRVRPEQPTGFGPAEVEEFLHRLGSGTLDAFASEAVAFAVPVEWEGTPIVGPEFVDAAHRTGREVYVWTVNDTREMHALLDLGVDGLISDHPERLVRVVGERESQT